LKGNVYLSLANGLKRILTRSFSGSRWDSKRKAIFSHPPVYLLQQMTTSNGEWVSEIRGLEIRGLTGMSVMNSRPQLRCDKSLRKRVTHGTFIAAYATAAST
jgi:hypothetical protein